MDASGIVLQNIGNIRSIASGSLNAICKFKKLVAIEAYGRARGDDSLPCVQSDGKIVQAVNRWTAHDDVRIEFYAANGSGEIRVKVIKNGAGGKICDMSLTTFISSFSTTM